MEKPNLSSKRTNLGGVIRLTRPGNLAIAAATMAVLHWGWLARWTEAPPPSKSGHLNLALGMAVVVLLMAAGNLINAYFDVDEDRINRPDRAIVDRSVKRRVLILTHQVLNGLGLAAALWLTWRTGNPMLVSMAALISFLLWRYSARWKGRPNTGNIVVAALLAAVPLWLLTLEWSAWPAPSRPMLAMALCTFAGFAFAVGWQRELVKDALDIEGDRKAGKQTWAVIHGAERTRIRTSRGILLTALLYTVPVYFISRPEQQLATAGSLLPALTLLIAWWSLRGTAPHWQRANTLLKWTLILGFVQACWLPVW